MSLRSRARWIAAVTAVAIPALVLSTACSTDKAAAPSAATTTDTVALDQSNTTIIEWWRVGSDSGYINFNEANFVQTGLDDSGDVSNIRLLVQYSLPKLSGKGVVDSAKMYNFVCLNEGDPITDSIVVDHVSWGAVYQDSAAWGGLTLQADIGTLVRDTTTGWKSLDVTSSIQGDYAAKRAMSQYRFEYLFGTEPVGQRVVWFGGGDCGDGSPQPANSGPSYMVIWAH
jgi:hypothetical protein